MTRSLLRSSIAGLALVAATATFSTAGHAVSFPLTSDHCSGIPGNTGGCLGGAPNAGFVTVTQNGTSVDVTVDLAAGFFFVKTGAADFQNFKFNATDVVLTDITIEQNLPFVGRSLIADTGLFNGDGTGIFGFGIQCAECDNGGGATNRFSTDIIFHVANATVADLTAANNLGNIFVVDVLGPNGNTGPVDASFAAVPGPIVGAGLPALVMACGGLLGLARRRRQKIA